MRRLRLSGLVALIIGSALGVTCFQPAHSAVKLAPWISGLHVSGRHVVNGAGQIVWLHGVSRSGTEYACVENSGIFDGPSDEASVQALAAWHINAVRVPLNEECWLNDAVPGINPHYVGKYYRRSIIQYVQLLNRYGMVALLNLHESAPGNRIADAQQPMPDADHSPRFWSTVARTFHDYKGVIFDLFDEPFPDNDQDTAAASACFRLGGQGHRLGLGGQCPDVTYRDPQNRDTGITYKAASMQSLVDAVRRTGARQVLMLDGVQYSDSLSHWLQSMPSDPLHNLVASWHPYNFNTCGDNPACWNASSAPVAARVPLVAGEIGEDDCSHAYIDRLMTWLDAHGASYLAWSWNDTYGKVCRPNLGPDGDISVISDYSGTPYPGMGVGFQMHLACLAAGWCHTHDALASHAAVHRSTVALPSPVPCPRCWHPPVRTNWQWQLTEPVDLSVTAQMYDVDLFDTPAAVVRALHTRHRIAICYVDAGSWEKWRPDAARFPHALIGKAYDGWPGEWWLDIRAVSRLMPLMDSRLNLCKTKGFDGVELDNVDGYGNDTGFPLTAQEQLAYDIALANDAHRRGLSVALKNDSDQVPQLLRYFDWALDEECFHNGWCNDVEPFLRAGKAVMDVEYQLTPKGFCPQANAMNINAMAKRVDLSAPRLVCR